ncbi:hypothetical protein BH24DEI1_BH24DEI1_13810 [soil metagenome]
MSSVKLNGRLSYYPAQGAIIPSIVAKEALPSANSLVQGATQLLGILGPGLAGVAVGVVGGELTLIAAACAYALAATVLLFVRLQAQEETAGRPGFVQQLAEGFRTVWADPVLKWLIVVIAVGNLGFVGPFFVGLPVLVRQSFGLDASAFGLLTGVFSLGSFMGISLAALTGKVQAKGKLVVGAAVLINLGLGLMGVAPNLLYSLGFLFAAGIGSGIQNILLITLIQLRTSQALLGRVMSLILVGSFGLSPLSQFLAGAFAELYGVSLLFPLGALLGLGVLLVGARWFVRL